MLGLWHGKCYYKELAAVLKNLTVLKKLSLCIDFTFSGIQGNSGPKELREGLKELMELQELSLELRWELKENDDVDEAAVALADGLKHLHNLSVLILSLKQNGSCSEIVSLFKSLTQLKELDFKWKSLGDKNHKLLEGLKQLKELRKLDLSWNAIEDNDIAPLTEVLKHMNYLDSLNLSHNKIGDTGLQLLADAIDLQYLSNLEVLLLDGNKFSSIGAKVLSEKVVKLPKLRTFDLGLYLGIYSADAMALIHQQKANEKPMMTQKPVISDISSNEQCNMPHMTSFNIFIVSLLMAVVAGGFLYHFALKSIPVLLVSDSGNNKALSHKGISESLAQGIFSTTFAWKLENLNNRLNGSGTVIAIFDTADNLELPAFCHKNLQNKIKVLDFLGPQMPISLIEHGNICASVAAGLRTTYLQQLLFPVE